MKSFYLWILPLLFFYNSNAQTANIANCGIQADEPPGCLLCDSILIIDNDIYTGEFPGPTYECGYIENNFWVAFISDGNYLKAFDFSYNCEIGSGTQSIIYNQNFEPVSPCFSTTGLPGDISAANLEENQVYYFMVDGMFGDICTDRYEFISGIKFPALDTPVLRSATIIPDTVCPGERVQLSFDSLSRFNEITLETSQNQLIEKDEQGLHYIITFLEPGPDTISYFAKTPCKNGMVRTIPIFIKEGFVQNVIDTALCQSICIPFRDTVYCDFGNHTYFSPSPTGCDSAFIISLKEGLHAVNFETINICEGDSTTWRGQIISEGGRYREIKTDSLTGCDSIFELKVLVRPHKTDFFVISIMKNDTFLGRVITTDTTISDTFQTIYGCDSIRRYSLNVEMSGLPSLSNEIPGLHLFPNPNDGNFVLRLEQQQQIEGRLSLYDAFGKIVFRKEKVQLLAGDNPQRIPFDIQPGLYQLVFDTGTKSSGYRIMIQR